MVFEILFFVFLVYSIVCTYFCLKFAMTILRVQDSIQDSLDIIDEKHQNITEILARPLFYDSPEVRQVLVDIESARGSLHKVAYDLTEKLTSPKE